MQSIIHNYSSASGLILLGLYLVMPVKIYFFSLPGLDSWLVHFNSRMKSSVANTHVVCFIVLLLYVSTCEAIYLILSSLKQQHSDIGQRLRHRSYYSFGKNTQKEAPTPSKK